MWINEILNKNHIFKKGRYLSEDQSKAQKKSNLNILSVVRPPCLCFNSSLPRMFSFPSPVQERLRSRCYLICWNRPGFPCVHHPLDLVLAPGMALGCAFISQVRLTHLPLPALSSKRVLVIHLHILRDRRWTVVTHGVVQVWSNRPFSSSSPTRHFFPAVSRERHLWILFFFPSSPSLSALFSIQ